MDESAGADAEFWRGALLSGGFTPIPRWTLNPEPGVAACEAVIAGDLVARLQRLSDELQLPFSSVLLTAHAKVLAALCGEEEVATGYVADRGADPLLCRLSTKSATWRSLLIDVHRVGSELLAHKDFRVDVLRSELRLTDPLFETVLDPTGGEGELAKHTVAQAETSQVGDQLVLRLRYR